MKNKPNETILVDKEKEYFILTKESVQERIYMIRGEKVMLDFELAEIYGYSTKAFNQQVKNNIERFDGFMFQLTNSEMDNLTGSKILTSIMQTKGMRGGRTTTLLSYRIFYLWCGTSSNILQSLLYGSLANKSVWRWIQNMQVDKEGN